MKLSWNKYFINIAEAVSKRSSCCRRQVGAILVKDKRIISTGYNGTPFGIKNCDEGGCLRCNSDVASGSNLSECVCSHAEENAIVQAARHGISVKDSVIFTTLSPCFLCVKMLINAGIKEIIYKEKYDNGKHLELLKDSNIEIYQLED